MALNITKILEESAEVENLGYEIKLQPIVDIYDNSNTEEFLSNARDYIWFGEHKKLDGGEE